MNENNKLCWFRPSEAISWLCFMAARAESPTVESVESSPSMSYKPPGTHRGAAIMSQNNDQKLFLVYILKLESDLSNVTPGTE